MTQGLIRRVVDGIVYEQIVDMKFSPDQPRDDHGRFGMGVGHAMAGGDVRSHLLREHDGALKPSERNAVRIGTAQEQDAIHDKLHARMAHVMSSDEARRRGLPIVKPEKPKYSVAFRNVEKGGIRTAYAASIHVNGVHVGYVQRERGDPAFKAISHTGLVMSRARELSEVREDIQSSFEAGEVPMPDTQ